MSLSVLKQLGINLYSAIPPVLSEAVANAWDADAENVDITISGDEIVIEDDGHGMTVEDANDKYLFVGYERRKDKNGGAITPNFQRKVMGRKGIGKLSLFSIANIVEVHSAKNGERHGFKMDVKDIEEKISNDSGFAEYSPEPLLGDAIKIDRDKKHGTKIILKKLKRKRLVDAEKSLKRKIARRFSILGDIYNFNVKINGSPVAIIDRDYFHRIQYLWYFGSKSREYISYCDSNKLKYNEERGNDLKIKVHDSEENFKISGWIGSVEMPGDLDDKDGNLNKIVIMVRGKLAQEDILEDFLEGRLFIKYLIGEIHADFFDLDNEDDSATSNRQEIIKDDPRYQALKQWLNNEIKHIGNCWTDLRNAEGENQARNIEAIDNWFKELEGDDRKYAKVLFGRINQFPSDSREQKNELFKQGVLAFENLKYKKKLELLNRTNIENLTLFTEVLADFDDIEATMYYRIVKERLGVIEKLHKKVDEHALEKVLQKHLYDHLWLLDPSWDRATETPYMEQQVKKEFGKVDANLTEKEKRGRLDIKYKMSTGKHIIIELKHADRVVSSFDILNQVTIYREALKKLLRATGKENEPIEVISIVGKELNDWTDERTIEESRLLLSAKNIRVITYQQLIEDAYRAYEAFMEKNKEVGRLIKLLDEIEVEVFS